MSSELVPIASLILDPSNARKHSKKNLEAIKGSLARFGQQKPIVISKDNIVIAGNGTLEAAKSLGWSDIEVKRSQLSGSDITAYAIADNRTGELADWDAGVLSDTLKALQTEFDLGKIGFDANDLAKLIVQEIKPGLSDEDEIPEQVETRCKSGDLWLLGEHRLLCGDSTDVLQVERLMGGHKVDITFTSPPYNVGKTPNGNDQKYLNSSDSLSSKEYADFITSFVNTWLLHSDYVFENVQSLSGNKIALIEHLYVLREKYADTIIWDKETAEPAMARRVLNSQFEYIYIFSNEAKRTVGKRDFRGSLSNVVRLNSRAGKDFAKIHKATFRVEFPQYFIENFTETSCADPFCGTGTTLIACEKTGRKCYGMEIDPHYCDVILSRWEKFTGKTAILSAGKGSAYG